MSQAGFCFDAVDELLFVGKLFVTSGFCTGEKNAIREEIKARSGRMSENLVLEADYLIVKEEYPVQTKKYLRALELKKRGYALRIIPDSLFYAKTKEPLGAKLSVIPAGGGRLHYRDAIWRFAGGYFDWREKAMAEVEKRGAICAGQYSKYTQYLIYDPKNTPRDILEDAKKREKEGTLVAMTPHVCQLWTRDSVTDDFFAKLSYEDTISLLCHYLTHQQAWESSINGADTAVIGLLRKHCFDVLKNKDRTILRLCSDWMCRHMDRQILIRSHLYLADLFYEIECFEELFFLLDVLREQEKIWVREGCSDGFYTYLLAEKYLDKTLADGNTENKARFLAFVQDRFGKSAQAPELTLEKGAKPNPYWIPGVVHTFGAFPQSAEGAAPEPVEWIVLDVKDGKALLLSRYALDVGPFSLTSANWEHSMVREWLNGAFLNTAFSARERKRIETTNVIMEKNPLYPKYPGNNTADKIFLLSMQEASYYIGPDADRRCAITDYAKSRGADTYNDSMIGDRLTCCWWLRSPGQYSFYEVFVNHWGFFWEEGNTCGIKGYGIRPALRLSLKG